MKPKNNKYLVLIAVAVLLPLFCYLAVKKMSTGKVKMPGYYLFDTVLVNNEVRDTVWHQTGELELITQVGEKKSLNKDLEGKIVVVNLFFADCNETCPKLSSSMALLQKSFKKDAKKESSLENVVQLVSLTVQPEHDSFQVLRRYADRFSANPDHWWFMTGDKRMIYNFARKDLGLATGPGDGGAEDFIHSDKLVLLDKDRNIRGYYSGLNDSEVRKCADDIVLLTIERKKKRK